MRGHTPEQRRAAFWAKVIKVEDGCWEWTGSRDHSGRARFGVAASRSGMASRVLWLWLHGPIPDGLEVCHTCDNPGCVRPEHLFLGTRQDNMDDKVAKGRQARGEVLAKFGVDHPQAKLTAAQVLEIRARAAAGVESQRAIARAFGVKQSAISRIHTGVRRPRG